MTPVTSAVLDDALTPPQVGRLRLLVGLVQGLALYGLFRAAMLLAWPAAMPTLFVGLLLAVVLCPVLLISGLGHLPRRALLQWVLGAAAVAAALGGYDVWCHAAGTPAGPATKLPAPSAPLVLAGFAGFFIAHALVLTGYAERRRIASYDGYFETAWKLGVQLAFSGLFVGAAWLVLILGAQLFLLVKLTWFNDIIVRPWFAIPVTVFAFTAAIHITDVRPSIVRGIRSLLLTLMSWILPIATLIIAGFLLSLPFTGLAPLWATRSATAMMLAGAALLVVMINAAWQNGAALADAPPLIRASSRLACLLLPPLCVLAGYALYLRVAEHGWTHERIAAAACVIVACCYAAGYLWATPGGAQLARIAPVNIGVAFVVLAILLALFSPLANPQRLAVASQLARLDAGNVSAQRFDYAYLRREGGRYGRAALAALSARTGKDAVVVREGAARALAMNSASEDGPVVITAPVVAIGANITLWPATATFPASFTASAIRESSDGRKLPSCLDDANERCDAFLLDLLGDTRPEIVLVGVTTGAAAHVLAQDGDGAWVVVGRLPASVAGCRTVRDAIIAGNMRAVAATGRAIDIAGKVVEVDYSTSYFGYACDATRPWP